MWRSQIEARREYLSGWGGEKPAEVNAAVKYFQMFSVILCECCVASLMLSRVAGSSVGGQLVLLQKQKAPPASMSDGDAGRGCPEPRAPKRLSVRAPGAECAGSVLRVGGDRNGQNEKEASEEGARRGRRAAVTSPADHTSGTVTRDVTKLEKGSCCQCPGHPGQHALPAPLS